MPEQVELHFTHPDDFRQWVRENKSRDTVEKVMTEQEAVSRFVPDGAYLAYDFSSLTRGPQALIREIIRQGRRRLGLITVPTGGLNVDLAVGAGVADRLHFAQVGLEEYGMAPNFRAAVQAGRLLCLEYP